MSLTNVKTLKKRPYSENLSVTINTKNENKVSESPNWNLYVTYKVTLALLIYYFIFKVGEYKKNVRCIMSAQ